LKEGNETKGSTKSASLFGWLFRVIKGAIIGVGAILPGISGGVLCVVLGVYKPMMEFLAHPIKSFKKHFELLLPVGIGCIVGFLLLARAVDWLFRVYEVPATWFFIGLVVGTLPSLYREAGLQGRGRGAWIAFGVSTALFLTLMLVFKFTSGAQATPSFLWWVICGVLWGIGLIVPGLSPSSFFIYFGLYQPMTAGIGNLSRAFDSLILGDTAAASASAASAMSVILPLGLGIILCVVLFARLMRVLLEKRYAIFFHAILGVVIASTISILPFGSAQSAADVIAFVLCFAAGCAIAYLMDVVGKKLDSEGQRD